MGKWRDEIDVKVGQEKESKGSLKSNYNVSTKVKDERDMASVVLCYPRRERNSCGS